MDHAADYKRCMETLDVKGIRALHAHITPHLPQPKTDAEALAALHMARTQSPLMSDDHRCYSHAWLTERGLPSQLPDEMRAKADRLYPRVAEGVGISVRFSSPALKPAANIIQGAMSDAVMDAYADGRREPEFVKTRMAEARAKVSHQLFGRIAR